MPSVLPCSLHHFFFQNACFLDLSWEMPVSDNTACDVNCFSFNPYSAGIDFSRQNLTSADIRF